jgi:benzoyl-CoA reductase/2-hydroxyglutaryl-CoA dehydratase subunit BcrC/BadD/HgdB
LNDKPTKIALEQWETRYADLRAAGLVEPAYGGPLQRHVGDGDFRLLRLKFDNSAAALRLWNFLLTEEDRLHEARAAGRIIVGAMKDLGTVPVMAYCAPNVTAFYPDGAWWIPCVMELSSDVLNAADSLGINESFCPVRAMLGAFVTGAHFPIPDLLVCSAGATCDDFSAIAQRLNGLGHPILWWEIPHRRRPEPGEDAVELPGGFAAPAAQVAFVRSELERVRDAIESACGGKLDEAALTCGIRAANEVRRILKKLRQAVFTAAVCPLPALELQIAEMLAIHFCSDRDESARVLRVLLERVRARIAAREGFLSADAARICWVNPVADIQVMNLLEDCGGRLCGTDFMFGHALDEIPENVPPMEALARTALADPMVGSAGDRARRIARDIRACGAEAVVVSRIPGASHCATEGMVIGEVVRAELDIPVVEIEVPPISDAIRPKLRTQLEALVETVRERRRRAHAVRGH